MDGDRVSNSIRECDGHIRRIAKALHDYEVVNGTLPPAFLPDELGRPKHSWRVLILPFLGYADVYSQYRFSEPWNSEHNRQLADRINGTFICPLDATANSRSWTSYVAVVGDETMWPGKDCRKTNDLDRTQDTLLTIEIAHSGIHWMEPRDIPLSDISESVNSVTPPSISSVHPHFNDGDSEANVCWANDFGVTFVRSQDVSFNIKNAVSAHFRQGSKHFLYPNTNLPAGYDQTSRSFPSER
jgi:hypothetical protein